MTSEDATYRKVTWRLLPLLFLCYVLAYLDRVNVGFAKLQMQKDLAFSDTVYGIGAGVFFIGYFLFEVPSNLILERVGARIWIARIMILWGLLSSATMFVAGERSFYVLRFALGVAEAGFFPGIILYLTYWYTRKHRARMVAGFMTAITLSGVIGGPVSGFILARMSGASGLAGWQWLYLLEGLPSVAVGILVLSLLDDGPSKAKWLTEDERDLLARRIREEEELKAAEGAKHLRLADAFRSGKLWLLAFIYFCVVMGLYGISFWLPSILSDTMTSDPWRIGLLTAVPWAAAALVMVTVGRNSDRTGERRWHTAIPALVAGAAFATSAIPGISPLPSFAALTVATCGVMAAVSCFWSLPTAFLSGTAAAAGIAWINSLGNLAGYVSPFVVGSVRDRTGSMSAALLVLAGSLLAAGTLTLWTARMPRRG
ncbi:MAG TPA: MFS transporter [Vicinamibacteria bacterium]|nr:MFS transporter [Vicinamibacteria bacterium]